jgi:threonine synthase
MNVKLPNNIPRILHIFNNDIEKMRELIYPVTVSDKGTAEVIEKVHKETVYLLDVHSAVSVAGVFDFIKRNPEFRDHKFGAFLTAEPAKFPEKMKKITGFEPPMPAKLRQQLKAKEKNVFSLAAHDMDGLRAVVYETKD